MELIQKPKGTYDLYGHESKNLIYFQNLVNLLCEKYNYTFIKTPMFEKSELFHRGIGEGTDIVSKETYDFKDRGDRDMTLRPEGTAGVVRSLIENKLYIDLPLKTYYMGSMFRYERPQSGRFREHTQFGVEVFGSDDPMIDAEVISIATNLFNILGLKGIKVNLNSIGSIEDRVNYRKDLIEYFKPHLDDLCEDCKNRIEKNPLRILDCKVDNNKDFFKQAPLITNYLSEDSKAYFEKVKTYLELLNIEYTINPRLVRGLDYYNHTIFEIEADIKDFGSQNVICGGGRYNGLVANLGGPDISGIGFGMGIERVLAALKAENINLAGDNGLDIYIVALDEESKPEVLEMIQTLRLSGFKVDTDYLNRNLTSNFKQADRYKAKYIIIIGEEERKENIITIKNNKTQTEEKIELAYLINYLDERISDEHDEEL
ncbi:MAG: histidine--tRNA ligase [Bacilli bacterium]|nr:histidine--tRNA ligase [Bacilli bacterium]